MPEHLITKCPHCGKAFRLTQAHLDIAGGAVRCGACYQVFHAAEHIVKTSVVEERRTVTKPVDPVEEAFDIKSDEGLDPYESADLNLAAADDPFKVEYLDSMESDAELDESASKPKKRKKKGPADESWAQDLLAELGDDEDDELIQDGDDDDTHGKIISGDSAFSLDDDSKPKKASKGTELSDSFSNLGDFDNEDPFAFNDSDMDDSSPASSKDDESWAKAMLDELEEEEKPRTPQSSGLALADDLTPPAKGNPFAARDMGGQQGSLAQPRSTSKKPAADRAPARKPTPVDEDPFTQGQEDFFGFSAPEPTPPPQAKSKAAPKPAAKQQPASLYDQDDEPDFKENFDEDFDEDFDAEAITPENLFADSDAVIEQHIRHSTLEYGLGPQDRFSRGTKNAALGLLMVLLLAGLAGQYAWYNFDTVSRIPTLRPYLEQYCPLIGCVPAQRSNVAQIVGTNLVVRSHPFEKNALVIDVIIKNQASFDQPYPVVQLNFEDLNGNPVASRRFAPRDYISDKSIALDTMPRDTPIHLTLEIVDPGRDAVNYELLFLPAGSPT